MDLRHLTNGQRSDALVIARPAARLPLVGALLAMLLAVGFSLVPVRASAYPGPTSVCTCTVSTQHVKSGQKIVFTGDSKVPLNWRVTFNGVVRTKSNSTHFVTSFVAPKVATTKHYKVVVDSGFAQAQRLSSAERAAYLPCHMSFDIQIDPANGRAQGGPAASPNGALPNTGGPQLALLGVALLLLLLGVASIRRARRDSEI